MSTKTQTYTNAFESAIKAHALALDAQKLADADALSAVKSAVRGKYAAGKDRVSRAAATLLVLEESGEETLTTDIKA